MFATFNVRNEVPLHVPVDSCCNCGGSGALEQIETKLRLMPLYGLVGAELTVPVPLPYCNSCKATARRTRPNALGVIALTALLAIGMITAWFFGAGDFVDRFPIEYAAGAAVALSSLLVLLSYSVRRARPPQSSYYQPVRIIKLSQRWPADITAMVLRFSNPTYAKSFEIANSDSVNRGLVKVVVS